MDMYVDLVYILHQNCAPCCHVAVISPLARSERRKKNRFGYAYVFKGFQMHYLMKRESLLTNEGLEIDQN